MGLALQEPAEAIGISYSDIVADGSYKLFPFEVKRQGESSLLQ